ncbi:MAG TPA: type IV secretion system protein VirB10 [Steroidobacteraceae bacterium]
MSSLLAAGLMTSVGAGMLAWYYGKALSRPAALHGPAQLSLAEAAGAGMTLTPLGPIGRPTDLIAGSAALRGASVPAIDRPSTSAARSTSPVTALPIRALLEPPLARAPGGLARGYGAPPQPSPRELARERRLSGEVFAGEEGPPGAGATGGGESAGAQAGSPMAALHSRGSPSSAGGGSVMDTLLQPSVLKATRAQLLPTQRLLLSKGTFIDCTLETAIDSTLPGMTTCITATDTFGADGTVVLLERGTKLIGQTRGEVRQGEARVFVVWTEARTPAGVVVQLDSPGTDALGRSGLEGKVNRHFWQRFGAAALVSTIDGVVQSEVQSSSRGGTVVLDPTASEDVLTEILRSTVSIPPTVRVRNGARIQVLVARDVDFRAVYELEPR